jgi:ATP-dependent Clp protease ATP-binding subunit ClpA
MARVIQEYIKKPLAEELLFGKLEHGGIVKISTEGEGEDQKLAFEFLPADPALKAAKIKAEEEDDDDDVVDDDPPAEALVGAGTKRSLSGPKKPSGAVPSVPRRRKED